MLHDNKVWVGTSGEEKVYIYPKMANRHGMIAGATGTGKTVTCSSITLGSSWTTNYKLSTTSKTTTANITAKEITVAWGSTTSWTYDGSSHAPTVTTPVMVQVVKN